MSPIGLSSLETRMKVLSPNYYNFKKPLMLAHTIRASYNIAYFKNVFLKILTAVWSTKVEYKSSSRRDFIVFSFIYSYTCSVYMEFTWSLHVCMVTWSVFINLLAFIWVVTIHKITCRLLQIELSHSNNYAMQCRSQGDKTQPWGGATTNTQRYHTIKNFKIVNLLLFN